MALTANPDVVRAIDPPIAEAFSWLDGRVFPEDRPLLDLAQAVPSYPPAEALTDHLAERTALFESARYTPIAGIEPLRAELSQHFSTFYGGDIGTGDILISSGCNQAYCLAILALARAGDEVILPAPYYFNHQMWLEMQGITPRHLPCRAERGGVPDPEEAKTLIGPKTKAIVLVTPNNPTGAVYPPEVLTAFRNLAREAGIALILDETYKDFLEDDGPPHDLFQDPDWRDVIVHLYSFSKAFSLTGYRVGSVTAGPQIMAAVLKIMDTISICAPRIGQDAALYGLRHLWDWVAEKRGMLDARREALREAFRANDLGWELISTGAYFAYVRHPFNGQPAQAVARRMIDRHDTLVLPGPWFGPGQDQFLRFAFANLPAERMPMLAGRLRESLG